MKFFWDEAKDLENQRKHGVSFDEAKSVFFDEKARLIDDPDHSNDVEDRFILMGFSVRFRVLIVCHCYRENDEVIRIISARKANKAEKLNYKEI